jgi:hypothetical protein
MRDGASILIILIERKASVGVAGTAVDVAGSSVGAGSVVAAAGTHELNSKTNRIGNTSWGRFILPPGFSSFHITG